jgi:hypothetical protein
MALSMEEESWLSDLLESVDDDDERLSTWQRGFIADIRKRFENDGQAFFLSPKMKVKLQEIEERATS